MCRFTRLTNAFSKRIESYCATLALYFFHCNFCRQHKSLRVSPAMQAGIADTLMSMTDLCAMMDAANPLKKRGPLQKEVGNFKVMHYRRPALLQFAGLRPIGRVKKRLNMTVHEPAHLPNQPSKQQTE
jgi:hypothetical protein